MNTTIRILEILALRVRRDNTNWVRETQEIEQGYLTDLVELVIEGVSTGQFNEEERKHLRVAVDALNHGGDSWKLSTLNIPGLDGMDPREAIETILLARGMDPLVYPIERNDDAWLSMGNRKYWKARMDWAVSQRFGKLCDMLLWSDMAAEWHALHGTFHPGGISATGLQESALGWAWIVRSAGAHIVQLFLSRAPHIANLVDETGNRPALAYVQNDEVFNLLREHGADPLAMDLPFDQRMKRMKALWEGWRFEFMRGKLDRARDYLLGSLRNWPCDEQGKAVAFLLACIQKESESLVGAQIQELEQELLAVAQLPHAASLFFQDEATQPAWPWHARAAWAHLMGKQSPDPIHATLTPHGKVIDPRHSQAWTVLEQLGQRDEDHLARLIELHDNQPTRALAEGLVLAIEQCLDHGDLDDTRISLLAVALGNLCGTWSKAPWIAAMFPIDAMTLGRLHLRTLDAACASDGSIFSRQTADPVWWATSGRSLPTPMLAQAAILLFHMMDGASLFDDLLVDYLQQALATGWSMEPASPGMAVALASLPDRRPDLWARITRLAISSNTEDAGGERKARRL